MVRKNKSQTFGKNGDKREKMEKGKERKRRVLMHNLDLKQC